MTPEPPTESSEPLSKRPLGATVLGWLACLGGMLGTGTLVFLVLHQVDDSRANDVTDALGPVLWVMAAGFGVVLVGTIATGVGLLSDRRWGWWAALASLAYAVLRNLSALAELPAIAEEFPELGADRYTRHMLKHAVRLVGSVLCFAYILRSHVRAHYEVATSPSRAAGYALAGAVTLWAALALLVQLAANAAP